MNFETERIDLCINFIKELKQNHQKLNGSAPDQLCVMATGGGAYKYYDKIKGVLGVDVLREDEMECLIIGIFPRDPRFSRCTSNTFTQVWISSLPKSPMKSSLPPSLIRCSL